MHVGRSLFGPESLILALQTVGHAFDFPFNDMRYGFRIIGIPFYSKVVGYAF